MASPYAIYQDLPARIAEIKKLQFAGGLAEFIAHLAIPENLDAYFPRNEHRAVIEEEKSAKTYYYFIFELLNALGFQLDDDIAATFVLHHENIFWRRDEGMQESSLRAVTTVFLRLYESLFEMGFVAHCLELMNILAKDFRSRNAKPFFVTAIPPEIKRVKERMVRRYAQLRTNELTNEQTVEWMNYNRFSYLTPMPVEERQAKKATEIRFAVKKQLMVVSVCKHGFMAFPKTEINKAICGLPEDLQCDYEAPL